MIVNNKVTIINGRTTSEGFTFIISFKICKGLKFLKSSSTPEVIGSMYYIFIQLNFIVTILINAF